jgi:hypothetical protein
MSGTMTSETGSLQPAAVCSELVERKTRARTERARPLNEAEGNNDLEEKRQW